MRAFAPARSRLPGVNAEVAYLVPTSMRPFNYMYEPPTGTAWQNCEYLPRVVSINDARARTLLPSVQIEGFELWDAPTAMKDFSDDDTIRNCYYDETAELARCATHADRAVVFDHLVRRREAGRPALNFGRQSGGAIPGAVGRIHNDYSEASGRKRFEILAAGGKIQPDVQRFAIVNVWRSIGGKIADSPLAICDARSVSVGDLVAADVHYPDRSGEIYLLHESSRHRWSYFPEMDCHEALVFKQFDSQVSGVARFTPHCAFDLPEIPPGTPCRQSIELRCLVTYE